MLGLGIRLKVRSVVLGINTFLSFKTRVQADGGTMYGDAACTLNKLKALEQAL